MTTESFLNVPLLSPSSQSSLPGLRINTDIALPDDTVDDNTINSATNDICIEIMECSSDSSSSSVSLPHLIPLPIVETLNTRAEFSLSRPSSSESTVATRLANSTTSSSARTKRASKIFTFDIQTSPTISKCPTYCDCFFHASAIERIPFIGPLIILLFPSLSSNSLHKSHSRTSSWTTSTLFIFVFCLIVLLPSFLYIMLHSSLRTPPVQPHLSFPVLDASAGSFSIYERTDMEFDRMGMDDNWYFS